MVPRKHGSFFQQSEIHRNIKPFHAKRSPCRSHRAVNAPTMRRHCSKAHRAEALKRGNYLIWNTCQILDQSHFEITRSSAVHRSQCCARKSVRSTREFYPQVRVSSVYMIENGPETDSYQSNQSINLLQSIRKESEIGKLKAIFNQCCRCCECEMISMMGL